jgi:alcohol dehydrogenase
MVAEITRLFSAIGITPTLQTLGLAQDKLCWTAEQAIGIERLIKNNPRSFDLRAMKLLVCSAYQGDMATIRRYR